jgi:DNA polymerase III sliding clamp (beta) subunit (PCNA family)
MNTSKNDTKKAHVLNVLTLVRPSLATQNYIPVLTHVHFDGKQATSYNDVSAVSVRADLGLEGCVPGELLFKAVSSFASDTISFQQSNVGTGAEAGLTGGPSLLVVSGRSKIRLPMLPNGGFPFQWPALKNAQEIPLDASILRGIERCLISVGNDPTHPAQMGVTLDFDPNTRNAVLYSTDNATISVYRTKSEIHLPGDAPVILPTFFCQQLIGLAKEFPDAEVDLFLLDGAVIAQFGAAAKLFTKTMVDLEPLDFPSIVKKHSDLDKVKKLLAPIPDSWDSSFARALLVLSGEVDKATKITLADGVIRLSSTSPMGEADDSISFDGDTEWAASATLWVDPTLIVRASKSCGFVAFSGDRVVTLADADLQFVHLIAHSTK